MRGISLRSWTLRRRRRNTNVYHREGNPHRYHIGHNTQTTQTTRSCFKTPIHRYKLLCGGFQSFSPGYFGATCRQVVALFRDHPGRNPCSVRPVCISAPYFATSGARPSPSRYLPRILARGISPLKLLAGGISQAHSGVSYSITVGLNLLASQARQPTVRTLPHSFHPCLKFKSPGKSRLGLCLCSWHDARNMDQRLHLLST